MRWKSDLFLLIAAALWGTGFVVQRLAAASMGAFAFNGGRFLLAGLMLFGFSLWSNQRTHAAQPVPMTKKHGLGMALAGVLMFGGAWFQQAGLETTTIGNASFITGLYVVLVPLLLFVFARQHIAWLSWVSVALAVVGVMLLSLQGELHFASGDLLELAGALLWAMHVILVGRLAAQGVNVFSFSAIQFTVCGLLSLAFSVVLEPGGLPALLVSWQAVVYSAIFPIGLGFTLQIFGQRHAPLVDASILLSMEAVFATLFGFLLLGETLLPQQMLGCALLLTAMLLTQIGPEYLKSRAV